MNLPRPTAIGTRTDDGAAIWDGAQDHDVTVLDPVVSGAHGGAAGNEPEEDDRAVGGPFGRPKPDPAADADDGVASAGSAASILGPTSLSSSSAMSTATATAPATTSCRGPISPRIPCGIDDDEDRRFGHSVLHGISSVAR